MRLIGCGTCYEHPLQKHAGVEIGLISEGSIRCDSCRSHQAASLCTLQQHLEMIVPLPKQLLVYPPTQSSKATRIDFTSEVCAFTNICQHSSRDFNLQTSFEATVVWQTVCECSSHGILYNSCWNRKSNIEVLSQSGQNHSVTECKHELFSICQQTSTTSTVHDFKARFMLQRGELVQPIIFQLIHLLASNKTWQVQLAKVTHCAEPCIICIATAVQSKQGVGAHQTVVFTHQQSTGPSPSLAGEKVGKGVEREGGGAIGDSSV